MERIIERCAGLDVHKSSVTACVRISQTRTRPYTRRSGSSLPPLEGSCCSGTGWLPLR